MQEGYQLNIDDKLKEAWSNERRFIHTRGLVRSLIWIVSLIITDLIVDLLIWKGIGDNRYGLGLMVINIGIIAFVIYREWFRYLKPYNAVRTALQVESKNPKLSSILITYTELSAADSTSNTSEEIVQAIKEKANEKTESINFQEIVSWDQIYRVFAISATIIIVFAGISVKWDEQVGTLLKRLRGVNVNYPTQTIIEKVHVEGQEMKAGESFKVKFGESLNITVFTDLKTVPQGKLYVRTKGSEKWPSIPQDMDPLANDKLTYERVLKDITEDTEFYVRVNDDKGQVYDIQVIKSPNIKSYQIEQIFPDYITKDPETVSELTLDTPQDTTLKWKITTQTKVKAMQVRVGEDETIDAEISQGGKLITFSRKADKAFNYAFQWIEGESGKDFEYGDVRNNIRVIDDTLPEVQLIAPSSDGFATDKKIVNLNYKGTDDYGLGKAHLIYTIKRGDRESDGESENTKKEIHDFEGKSSGANMYEWKISDHIKELKPGDQILYQIEVEDLFPGEKKHVRQSVARKISIVTPERYLQWYRAELASQQDEIKRARDSEETASTQVKQLIEQESEEK
ncbi:MAG TPA: hypothetical protein EYG40_02950 [Verrucomicrobia bacterium]|nr:hypothetical protein [Verrucomicrobiales bacterium]HIL53977.1 hypothetical protein [Verrucomicrobiota bacterium]